MEGKSVLIQGSEGLRVFKLSGKLGVVAAEALQRQCLDLQRTSSLVIDWSEAEQIEASAVQVLLALRSALAECQCTLSVVSDNEAVRSMLECTGLSCVFSLADPPEGGNANA